MSCKGKTCTVQHRNRDCMGGAVGKCIAELEAERDQLKEVNKRLSLDEARATDCLDEAQGCIHQLKAENKRLKSPRTFPIQGAARVPWEVAEQAYIGYVKMCGSCQTLERLGERGGFGVEEMDEFYPEWRSTTRRIADLQARAEAWKAVHVARKAMDDTNSPAINPSEAYISSEILYLKALETASQLDQQQARESSEPVPAIKTQTRNWVLDTLLNEWCIAADFDETEDAAVHLHELLNQAFNAGAEQEGGDS